MCLSCGASLILREKIRNAFGRGSVISSNAPAGDLTGLDQLSRGWRRDADLRGGLRRRYFGFALLSAFGHTKIPPQAKALCALPATLGCAFFGWLEGCENLGLYTEKVFCIQSPKLYAFSEAKSTCQSCQTRQTQKAEGSRKTW